jgi:hypothetical protein
VRLSVALSSQTFWSGWHGGFRDRQISPPVVREFLSQETPTQPEHFPSDMAGYGRSKTPCRFIRSSTDPTHKPIVLNKLCLCRELDRQRGNLPNGSATCQMIP